MRTIHTIILQYPIFVDHIIEFLSFKDIVNFSIVQKLFKNKYIGSDNIQWWIQSCLETNRDPCMICSPFKHCSYRFAKLNKLQGQVFYPIIKRVCGIKSESIEHKMFHSLRTFTQAITSTQNEMGIETNINYIFEFPLFRSHIIDCISYKDNKLCQIELLWFLSNLLFANSTSVKKLVSEYDIIPKLVHNLKHIDDQDLIEMYAWCIGNIMAESFDYYHNIRKHNGFKVFFQKLNYVHNENIICVILWVLSTIVKTDKLFIQLKIFQFTIRCFFQFQHNSQICCEVYNILHYIIKKEKKILYPLIKNIDLITYIVRDLTHVCPKTQRFTLYILSSLLCQTDIFTKKMYQCGLLENIKTFLYLNRNSLSCAEEQEIGRLICNIIIENDKQMIACLLQRHCDIIDYFIQNKHKQNCQFELIWIFNSICNTKDIDLISFTINHYNMIYILNTILRNYEQLSYTEIRLCFESFTDLYRLNPHWVEKDRMIPLFKNIISSRRKFMKDKMDYLAKHPFLKKEQKS